jgi:hypothetical protein
MFRFRSVGLAAMIAVVSHSSTKAQGFVDGDGEDQTLQLNTITTAVPFLMISPDARAGGNGRCWRCHQP